MKNRHCGCSFCSTRLASLLGLVMCAGVSGVALADPPTASGMAYDLSVNVSVLGGTVLNVTPVDQVQFSNQATAQSAEQTTPNFDSGGGAGVLARLRTNALDTQTQWEPGTNFLAAGSQATVDDLDLSAVNVSSASLLALQADVVQATAIVTGTCPPSAARHTEAVHLVDDYIFRNGFELQNLQATSTARMSKNGMGILLSLLGNSIADIPVDPAPNTMVSLSGTSGTNSLILNERAVSGDGVTGLGVATNALHLSLNVLNVITADVIISHAESSIACH